MKRSRLLFVLLSLLLVVLFALDLMVGSVALSPSEVWHALFDGEAETATATIVRSIRLVKAIVAVVAGAALAVSGLEMQTLFRNPLAGPFVLGISSGASLGVALLLLGAPILGVSSSP
ncbi:MAG: iron chelate uptake ABC transporter family permease subunit, partial [Alistipes sp.]|nr:iron chelate uptake ABC transporter family permease subunit [Alistipes sp.]